MLESFVPQMRPFFGDKERQYLQQYDFENGYLTEFLQTKRFEDRLSKFLGVDQCVAVNNGTIALSIAALAVGVCSGDEVIVPNFTMIATPNAMKLIGAQPVFVDVESETWCIDQKEIYNSITSKTKAVVLVSANGRFPSYSVDELRDDLNQLGIELIEDAAQSLGSFYPDGNPIGTKGNIATLSFSAPKIISTGQGGLVFSRDSKVSEIAGRIKDFGRAGGGVDVHPEFGINAKFTELQALVGCAQLDVLNDRMKRRKEQNILYEKHLQSIDGIELIEHNYELTTPWFMEVLTVKRDELAVFLKQKNIGTRPVYPEINKQPIYQEVLDYNISKDISRRGLWLPSHMGVTDEMIVAICDTIKEFFRVKS